MLQLTSFSLGTCSNNQFRILQGSLSAVSTPIFASKYSLESSRRDLHNALLCTVLESIDSYAAMKLTTAVARRLLPAQRQSRAKNQSRNPEDTKGRRRRKGQLSQTTVKSTKLTVILGFWTGAGITIAYFPSVRFCSFP